MLDATLLLSVYAASIFLFGLATRRLPLLAAEALHWVSALDGLRGVLATAVVVHHFAVTWQWHISGAWQTTHSRVLNNLGAVAVSLFFMITGYLFTRKVCAGEVAWGRLFASRVRRIYPMYLVTVVLIVALAFYQAPSAPLLSSLQAVGSWLLFVARPIDGYADTARINAGVQWTLLYEAVFYLSLPLLHCVLRRRLALWPVVVTVAILLCLWPLYHEAFHNRFLKLFVVGVVVALAERHLAARVGNPNHWGFTLLAIGVLAAALKMHSYSTGQMLILGVPFALFVLGNNLAGLLESRVLKVLGEASFSVYLLHGIVLYVLFTVWGAYSFDGASLGVFALCWLPWVLWLTSSLSVLAYWAIERPFIVGGHRAKRMVEGAA
ncbi:acyltransferase family protein [Pseudomonas typographi]|uniref:acyltransferase family protein n=1 Tax=Pseudomonas typographi TaxID=2715964 RepID=UPI001686EA21|nr:acyltransferase [Pseudomonas typographi]MBD1590277.1 acyltransferase [Pseudomonas typographi]